MFSIEQQLNASVAPPLVLPQRFASAAAVQRPVAPSLLVLSTTAVSAARLLTEREVGGDVFSKGAGASSIV